MSLDPNSLINIKVELTPPGSARRGLNTALLFGTTKFTQTSGDPLLRTYRSLAEVGADFGDKTENYKAAQTYFAQDPAPDKLMIAYFNDTASGADPKPVVEACMNQSNDWYGLCFPSSSTLTYPQYESIGALIESGKTSHGPSYPRIMAVTVAQADNLVAGSTTSYSYKLKEKGLHRTLCQYSSTANDAAVALLSKAFTTDYNIPDGVMTLMYKTESVVKAENLRPDQAATLKKNRANVYAVYDNDTSILQYGTMCANYYIDTVMGLDWLSDAIRTTLYNLLYTTPTKIPQTDAGQNVLVNGIAQVCDQAVTNGLIAPGIWRQNGFGHIKRGDFLKMGYYIYATPISKQPDVQVSSRIAGPIKVAARLAGAIHTVDVTVEVSE